MKLKKRTHQTLFRALAAIVLPGLSLAQLKQRIRMVATLGLIGVGTLGCTRQAEVSHIPVEPEIMNPSPAASETTHPVIVPDTYVKRYPVEPNTPYCLTFEVEASPEAGRDVSWVLHTFNSAGEQPFDGALEGDWQRLVPGQTVYRHAFRSVDDAVEVRLAFRGIESAPQLKTTALEPYAVPELVLNGDFALGAGNHSGWSQMNWAEIINVDGNNLLQVNQNGYALSDYFPVEAGAGYGRVFGGKLLAYDRDRRLIDEVPYVAEPPEGEPAMRMPAGATFGRILYTTGHDHIPQYTTNRVTRSRLVRDADQPAVVELPAQLPRAADEIVLAAGSDAREVYAARELQHWMAQITGQRPPLLTAPSSRENLKIYVGARFATAQTDDLAWLGDSDGYVVKRTGNAIYVFGKKPRGTIYGVFALLEQNSDIIWPRPNRAFEALWTPQSKITFEHADFRSRPIFAMRHLNMELGGYRYQEWLVRNGVNNDFSMHTGFDYLLWERGSTATYSKYHLGWIGEDALARDETFYPLVDGDRNISRWRQPCFTHPEVAPRIAANIRRALALTPYPPVEHVISIIADNWNVCACDRCMEPIRLPDGSLLEPKSAYADKDSLFFSTRNFMMLNAVAEDLAKDFPNLKLVTHAYIFTAEPPKVKVHPMIVPQFAAYPTQNVRFPIRAAKGKAISGYTEDIWKRRFEAWGRWHPKGLGYFGYYYTPGFNALADTAAIDFRDLAAMGGIHVHTEGFSIVADEEALTTWDVDGPEKWAITRLMWDPSQDPAELRETFMRKVYREAAPQMLAFHALISRGWHDPNNDLFVSCHASVQDLYEGLLEKPGLVKEARSLLVKAVAAAKHPMSKQLVQRTLDHFDLYGESLGRRSVPYVEEMVEDWNDAGSPHWQKALIVKDFKKVDDWRRFRGAPADPQTEVRLIADGKRLCLRVMAFDPAPQSIVALPKSEGHIAPSGDCVEITLSDLRGREWNVVVGPNGNRLAAPEFSSPWEAASLIQPNGWVAMVALPLSEFSMNKDNPVLKARVGRIYRQSGETRQESTPSGASLYNRHESFWMHLTIEGKE